MSDITDIKTTKTRLHRLLESATPDSGKQAQQFGIISKIVPTLITICLIGTMLPFQAVVAFFSLGAITIALLSLYLLWKKQIKFTKSMTAILLALTLTSVLSGCSPAFTFQTQQELIKFAHENSFDLHSIRRIGFFGLGLDDATIATAQADSHIKTIQGTQIDRGYGLVSITIVTIAGKS